MVRVAPGMPNQPNLSSPRRRPQILETPVTDLFDLQSLESRLLFSANTTAITDITLSAAAINGLQSGLNQVVKIGGALDDYGAIGDDLTGVGKSVGDLFDFGSTDGSGGFLDTELAQPLLAKLVAGTTKASDVKSLLAALTKAEAAGNSVTVKDVVGGYYASTNEFEWDFVLQGKRSSTFKLDPGSDLAAEGLSFSTPANVTIATTVDFHLSIGVKADGSGFFITLSDLDFAASADSGQTLNFNVGFAAGGSLSVSNGQVQLAAQLSNVTFPQVTPGVGGRISGAQLSSLSNGLAVGEVALGSVTSSLQSTLPLSLGTAPGQLTVLINDSSLFDTTVPDVSLKYYLNNADLRQNILDILGSLDGKVTTITDGAIFDQKIPLLDKTISDFLPAADFHTLLSFKTVAQTYFDSTSTPELGGLVDALTTHLTSLGSLAGSAIDFVFNAATKNFSVDFLLDANPSTTTGVKLPSFGDASTALGLNLPNDVTLTVKGSAKADFTLGLDLSGAIGANSAYIVVDEISAGASVAATGLNFGVTIGPMAANVVGGTVNLSAKGSARFSDPNSDGRISLGEFTSTTVSFTPSGTLDVKMPLQMSFGGYDFKDAGVDPSLHLVSANVFTTPVTVDTSTANFSRIFNLGKMGPEQVLDLMIAAGDWATQFRNAAIFDVQIPFLDNVDLGDAFDFGLLFAKNLRDKLSDNEAQLFAAQTSATLANPLSFLLQLDGNTANSKTITVAKGTYANAGALVDALNAAIKDAYGTTVPVTAVLENGPDNKPNTGDERVMLSTPSTDGTGFSLAGTYANLKTLGFYTGSTVATTTGKNAAVSTGKLTGDARLAFVINGAAPVLVTVTQTSTSTNTTVADLVTDVQDALTAAGITSITVSAVDGKLVFTGDNTVQAFMAAGDGTTKWDELGLEETVQAGMTSLGSVQKTTAKFATFQQLVPMLATALGLPQDTIAATYDPATETIKLHVKFGYNPTPIQVPVSFDLNLGDFAGVKTVDANGNEAPLKITLTPKLNAELDFGYTFKTTLTPEAINLAPSQGYVSPAGYVSDAATVTPEKWNGKLTADANFTVLLDNAKSVTLTVAKADTTTNKSVADLVDDINAAIAKSTDLTGKITASVLPASGETAERVQISTVAGASRQLEIQTGTADPAHTEIGFATNSFGQVSTESLAALNLAGQTVKYAPGEDAHFTVSIDDAAPVTITLAKSATDDNLTMADLLADLKTAISNAGLASKLQATRFGSGDRIQFSVLTNARSLRFDTDTTDAAHTKLGFSDDPTYQRARGGVFFIENAKITGSATLAVDDLRLAAQIGFIGIKTGDSSGSLTVGVTAELKLGTNTRFTIGSLFAAVGQGGIGSIVTLTKTGSANFSLTDITVDAGLFTLPSSPTIGFNVPNLFPSTGGLTITPIYSNLPALPNFSKLDFNTVFLGLKQAVNILANYNQFDFLNYHLPILNMSVVELFDYADKLRIALDELQENPAAALQLVETTIEETLGLPPGLVTLSVDGTNLAAIKLSIVLQKDFSATLGLNLDLNDLAPLFDGALASGWETLSGMIDAAAEGNIKVDAYARATIDLGIDLTGTTAKPFLYDSSGVEVGFRFAGTNLNFNANIGIVGLSVSGGSVLLDSDGVFDQYDAAGNLKAGGDGVIDADFATIRYGLKENNEGGVKDGRHYFTEDFSLSDDFALSYQGQMKATLPVSLITPLGNFDLDSAVELSTSAADFAALIRRVPNSHPIHIKLPSLDGLLPETPGIIQLLRDPSILLGGVDNVLYKIQQGLDSKTSQKLPLVGSRLSEGAQMIENFREGFLAELTEKLRGAGDSLLADLQETMFDFFGPGGSLNILLDLNGDDEVTLDDVVLTFRKSDGSLWVDGTDAPKLQDSIEFNIHLGQSYTAAIPDLRLDFALPGLELNVSGSPSITFDWNMYLGFGVSLTDLFYVNTKPTTDGLPKTADNEYVDSELEAGFKVKLTTDEDTPFTATGTLFFLQLQATDAKLNATNGTDGTTNYSLFSGRFFVDLNDPGVGGSKDDRLTFPELFKRGGTVKVIEPGLEAKADINLSLNLSVQGSKVIPRVLADFNLDWSWSLASGASPVKAGFNNVALDLGSFISDFLKPLCDQINGIIKPFDPILDALQTRIPVLSDLMGRDYTLLDLAVSFGKVDRRLIDAVLQIRSLIADIAAMPSGQNIIIPMGSIADFGSTFSKKGGAKDYDPVAAGISNASKDISSAPQSAQTIVSKSKSVSGGGFAFPILKPANIFKLLMGQEVVLFTYDVPRLEVGMSMSTKFSIFGPLVATFKGSITAFVDLAVGFDTKGLNQFKVSGDVTDILDGFYVSDRANADGTGADVPEAGMVGRIEIGGAVNFAVVEAGISGFFQLTANLDLNDPNDDGKIRGSEIIALLTYKTPDGKSYGPLNLASITLKGEVGARAYVDVFALFSWETVWEYEFFRATIFEKTFSAPRPKPTLATVASDGTLKINAGSSANQRAFGSTTDVGESFTLTQLSNGDIKVRFENTETEQILSGVTKVSFSAGKGNDVLDARGLTIPVEFDGGEGDDTLYAGDGGSVMSGGSGNDTIYGGKGVDVIYGGTGSDIIDAGAGDDVIDGGDGNDDLTGGLGKDVFKFADNWGVDSINFLGDPEGAKAANRDTFDFTAATIGLTVSVGSNQTKVSAGKSSITVDDGVGELSTILGGSGNDAININSSTKLGFSVDGGKGGDTYVVGFGNENLKGLVTVTDTGGSTIDDDTVVVIPVTNESISLYDAKVVLNREKQEQVNFTGIESVTVDAAKSTVRIEEALTFDNNVRLKGSTVAVNNTVDAGYIRVDSGNAIKIDADLNAHASGNIEVVVSKGDIEINANIWSSVNKSGIATGTGSGVIQLVARTGKIVTDSTGTVRADDGYLLLQGGTGSIGTEAAPILTRVATLAAKTTGSGVVNIHEADGLIVGDVSVISGLTSNGGNVTITNDKNSLTFNSPASANGGDMTFTSDQIQVNAALTSSDAVLLLQPLHTNTPIAIGDGVDKTFDLDSGEIGQITDGFGAVKIGREDGLHQVYIEDITFKDPTYIQNPILGGHVYQTGKITGTGNASLTIMGSGHTTDLDNQDVIAGNIDILDSARVRAGEAVRLEADAGNININFDLDGAGSGTLEKLTLNAPSGVITIKGNIGSLNIIDELVVENAVSVRFEGNVKVGKLTIQNVGSFTIDGTLNATDLDLQTVGAADFNSAITATNITHSTGTLGIVTFEGAVNVPTISLKATSLIDFYQNVDATTLTLETTGLTGDILLRQQLNATGTVTVTSLDDITFQGPVTANNLTVSGVNDLAFQSTLKVTGTLTQTEGTGVSSFAQVTVGSADITNNALVFNSSVTGTSTTGQVTLHATAGDVSITGVSSVANTFTITASGNIAFIGNATGKTVSLDSTNLTYGNLTASTGGSLTLKVADTGTISSTGATTSAGALTIARAASVTLTGAVNVVGAFTQSDTLSFATGTTSLGQVTAGSIDLRATNLTFGSTVTATTGAISLKAGTTGSISVNGALTATSGALAVSQAGTATFSAQVDVLSASITSAQFITVANNAAFAAAGAVTLTTTDTAIGEIKLTGAFSSGALATVTSARALSFLGAVEVATGSFTAASTINLGTGSITTTTGDLTLTTTVSGAGNGVSGSGPISIADDFKIVTPRAVTLNGSIEAATIDIDAASITLPGTIDATSTITLLAANTGNISLGSTVNAGGALTVNRVRDLSFGGLVTAASISVGSTDARGITVASAGLNTTGNLTLRSTSALGGLTLNGPLTSTGGTLTLTAVGNITAASTLNADRIVASAANVAFNGAVTADGIAPGVRGIVIDTTTAGTGSVNFGSTVTSAENLTIGATTRPQSVVIAGTVNVTNDFAVTSAETITANNGVTVGHDFRVTTTSTTAGEVRFVGALAVTHDLTLTTPRDAFFQGAVTVSHDLIITNVDDVQFQTTLTVTGALNQQAGTGTASYASIKAASVGVIAASVTVANGLNTTSGDAVFNAGAGGDVSIGGTVTVASKLEVVLADDVSFTGAVTANSVSLGTTQVRTITLGNNGLSATGNILLNATAANGLINANGALTSMSGVLTVNSSGGLTVLGAVNADRVVAQAASMSFGATLEAAGTGTNKGIVLDALTAGLGSFSFANTVTSADSITIGATKRSANVVFSGSVSAANDLAITAAETITLSAAVNVTDDVTLTTTSATVGEVRALSTLGIGGDLTLSAARDAIFQAAVNVTGDVTITTVDDVQFQAALNVTGTLNQQAGTGTATYASIKAASAAVKAANIVINNGLNTTTGDAVLNAGTTGDVTVAGLVTVASKLEVVVADDVIINGAVTANTISLGSTQVKTITFGNGGVAAAGNIVLNATAAGGSITASGTLTSTSGVLTANTVGLFNVAGAVNADRVVAQAAAMTFGSTLDADGIGANKGIVLDALTAGLGSFSFTNAVTSTDSITIGTTKRPANVVFSGSVSAVNDLTITTAETIILSAAVNVTDDVTLTTTSATVGEVRTLSTLGIGGDLTLNVARDAIFQAAVTVTGDVTITTVDDVQFQAALIVTGVLTQQAGTGTATYASIKAASASVKAANIVVNNGLNITTGDAVFNAGTTGDVTVGGLVTVTNKLEVVVADDVTITGAVTASTISLGSTQVKTITFGSGGVTASGNIDLNATAAGGSISAGGTLTSTNGVLTANTVGLFNAIGAVNADRVVAQAGSMTFGATLQADGTGANKGVVLDAATIGAGVFSFANTVTSSDSITIGATKRPAGVVFSGSVNAANDLAITSAETITLSAAVNVTDDITLTTTSTTAGEIRALSTLGIGGDFTLSAARDAIFQAAITVAGDVTIVTVNNVQFQAALTVTGTLDQQAGIGTASYSSIKAASVGVKAANIVITNGLNTTVGDAILNAGATGDVTIGGLVAITDDLEVVLADDVAITGTVTAKTITIGSTQVKTIAFGNGGVTATGNIVLNATATGGAINAGGAITSTDGILNANTVGALNVVGAVKADRVVGLAASMTFSSTLEADGTGTNKGIVLDAVTSGAGLFTFTNTVTSADSVTIGATKRPASAVFSGGISIGNDLDVAVTETITLSGAVNVADDVILKTASAIAGEVRALSTLGIGGDFILSAARDATFQAAVTVQGDATINTADDLQFQAALTVTGTLTQSAGTGVSSFANVLAGTVDLTAKSLQVTGSLVSQVGAIQLKATSGNVTVTGVTTAAAALTVHDAINISFGGKVTATQALLKGGSLNDSSDLIATTGGITILVTGDVTVNGSTLATLDQILIDGSEDVTLAGAVTAKVITIDTTSFTAGSTVAATAGNLTFTTIGNLAVTGTTTASASIKVTQAQSVTLSGAVSAADFTLNAASFLAGNTLTTTTGDVDLTTSGNIRVVGLATVARDLIVHTAANVTFQGQTLVTNKIQQLDGTATTRFEGVTQAASISLRTAQQILAGSTFRALTGDIFLESDEIDFVGGTNTVQGNAQLILRPYLAATTIDIGSPTPTGTLDLSDVDINALRDGFTQIVIGRAEDATGAMLIGSSIFKDNLALHAGSIVVEANTLVGQQVSTLESLEMTARTGNITINDDVDATDIALTARDNLSVNSTVQGQDFVTVTVGTDGSGGATISATGTLEGTAVGSDVTIATGANSGDLNVAGLISAQDDVTLTVPSGTVTQTAGKTAGNDLTVIAKSGITLLTTVDHINARVTAAGDMNITDNNPNLNHVLVLGSATDSNDGLFTQAGDIHVTANANGAAYRVIANGGVFLDFGGEIFVGTVTGSPAKITGTILIDEDRVTNGEDITFDGNVRLLRDITMTSNGGNITITGRVSGTVGSNFGLTLNAGTGDVKVGGPIGFDVLTDAPLGFLTVVAADEVTFGNEATDLAAIRVVGNIEIHSNDVEFNSPAFSVITTGGGELKLLPMSSTAPIIIGTPRGVTADYDLSDDDLRALGNSFSKITIGQAGGLHDITLESAQFRDSLVLNGDHVRFLTSLVPQSVNGLSVVNGSDDNSITVNAQSLFSQGRRAAISAGRYGNISITADQIELDDKSTNLLRGYGTLTLQPFTVTQAITLGGAGSADDFDLSVGEIGTLADGFSSITIGRADGAHAISIESSLSFRDSLTIQAPVGAGSITYGSALTRLQLKTLAKGDTLTLKAAGDVIIDGSLATAGNGALTVLADADVSGAGDLRIGTNLNAKNTTLSFTTDRGAIILRGENVQLSAVVPPKSKFGAVTFTSKAGNIDLQANLDGDTDGGVEIRNAKSILKTNGTLTIGGGTQALLIESAKLTALAGINLQAKSTIDLTTLAGLTSNQSVKLTAGTNLNLLTGSKITAKLGSIQILADRDDATDDGNAGLLTIGDGVVITSKTSTLLSSFQVQRGTKAKLTAKPLTVDQG